MEQLKEQENIYYQNLKAASGGTGNINYTQVESSMPSYSMRAKCYIDPNKEDYNAILIANYGKGTAATEPKNYEPNYNYIKPSSSSFTFGKEARFESMKKSESRSNLYPEEYQYGNDYQEYDQIDINSPGPGDYKVKGFADEIIERNQIRSLKSGKKSSNVSKSDITEKTDKEK